MKIFVSFTTRKRSASNLLEQEKAFVLIYFSEYTD